MHTPQIAPSYGRSSFNCPHCGAFAAMQWGTDTSTSYGGHSFSLRNLAGAKCSHCNNFSLWLAKELQMIYPFSGIAPLPNPDLPDEIKADYMEARDICTLSPRGSAALLRLCIQKLCKHLGEPGENINSDIQSLVKKGLDANIQKSLDIVRVIGNESVHPGTIDLRDDPDTARILFVLVNIIANALITQPNMIAATYAIIPPNKQQGIANRDKT